MPAHQRVVDAHFEATAFYWRDVYDFRGVEGAIYHQRRALALAMVAALRLAPAARILEIGCGAGSLAVTLARQGYTVDALDPVRAMIDFTRRLAAEAGVGERVVASLGDVHHLGFAHGAFDLVVALGVTPWLHTPGDALRELVRVVRRGGHVIVSADNRWRLSHLLDPRFFPACAGVRTRVRDLLGGPPRARVRMYAPARFDRMLAASGLEKQSGRTLGFGPFTLWNHRLLPEAAGLRLHGALQRAADRSVPGIRSLGAQYVVLARRSAGRGASVSWE